MVPQFQFKLLNPRREISPQDSHSPRLFACQLLILEMAAAQQAQDSAGSLLFFPFSLGCLLILEFFFFFCFTLLIFCVEFEELGGSLSVKVAILAVFVRVGIVVNLRIFMVFWSKLKLAQD